MSQRLVYANEIMEYLDNCCHYSDNPDYDAGYGNGINVAWEKLLETPGTDPVHATNACYCKECWYYTEWGECKEFGDIMKPDEFCSRGVMKNDKTN